MKNMRTYKGEIVLTLMILVVALMTVGWMGVRVANGSAPPGAPTSIATSSVMAVGPQQKIAIFPASNCTSRVISTVASGVMLSFGEVAPYTVASTSISGTIGVGQLASTTVLYDSGQYGCGLVTAYAFSSSSITVVEYR